MAKKPPIVIDVNDLLQEEEIPHAYSNIENDIVLPMFRFPEHWMIQDWLSNTEYGNDFDLIVLTGKAGTTVPALKPKKNKNGFKWILRGETGMEELEEIILDYAKNLKYNM